MNSTTSAPLRATLTLNCRIKSTRAAPQDWLEVTPEPKSEFQRAPAAPQTPTPALPPYHERINSLLDQWAEYQVNASTVTLGDRRSTVGAPDARIHTIEDMEIEMDKKICLIVDTAVWELPTLEREGVMLHYGIKTETGWRADFDKMFDLAIDSLYGLLKNRLVC